MSASNIKVKANNTDLKLNLVGRAIITCQKAKLVSLHIETCKIN